MPRQRGQLCREQTDHGDLNCLDANPQASCQYPMGQEKHCADPANAHEKKGGPKQQALSDDGLHRQQSCRELKYLFPCEWGQTLV